MTWSYIAGFFDGEGSITHNGKGFRITIAQTNMEVLDEIKFFVGAGNIISVTKRHPHWKDSWVYNISTQKEIYKFLLNVLPFLIVKKALAQKTIPLLRGVVVKQESRKEKREDLIKKTKKLREQGLTYRQIGSRLDIDFGHARRMTFR